MGASLSKRRGQESAVKKALSKKESPGSAPAKISEGNTDSQRALAAGHVGT